MAKNSLSSVREWKTLYSEEAIRLRIDELAKAISDQYQGKDITIIALLRGSFVFLADLIRALFRYGQILSMDFLDAGSYGPGTTTTGHVVLYGDIRIEITNRVVLLVDDIADTGLTLDRMVRHLREKHPADLKTCVFLDKPSRRRVPFIPDFIGFEVPDLFLVGYGLDHDNRFRELPFLAVLPEPPGVSEELPG
jgi:hypoxanthine phosphoribosyltransferase